MKIKSRVNGIIIEATNATAEILKLGNGAYARAISDAAAEAEESDEKTTKTAAKKTTTRKTAAKKQTPNKAEVEQIKKEAKAAGIELEDSQIEGVNKHDDDEDSVEVL